MSVEFYKKRENDTIWWARDDDRYGRHLFSFDKKKLFNLFEDYPKNMTQEQVEIFEKENQFWKRRLGR